MFHFISKAALHTLLIISASNSQVLNDEKCGTDEGLGTNSWERFDASFQMDVTNGEIDCNYSLTFNFKHDDTLPLPVDPAMNCQPGAIADDGIPYLGFRWYYEKLPDYVKKATLVDHISLDYNACGHPPVNVFTVPHYDAHIYLVSPNDRTCMTCDTIPFAPVCDPDSQSTRNGRAFFNVATIQPSGKLSNMPEGFEFGLGDNVPLMGGHSWNVENQPDLTSGSWEDPIWIMGSYDGAITNFEPMFPLSFVTGNDNKVYTESLEYVGRTVEQLPTKYTVKYDGTTQFISITFEGKSALCGEAFNEAKNTNPSKSKKSGKFPKEDKTSSKFPKKGKTSKRKSGGR